MKKIIVDLLSKSLFYDHHIHHIHIFIQLGKRLKSSEIDFFTLIILFLSMNDEF